MLVFGVVLSAWLAIEATRAKQEALDALTAEAEQRQEAVKQKTKAEEAEEMAKRSLAAESQARKQTRVALDTLTDNVVEKLLARQSKLGPDERAFLRKVLGFYEEFTKHQIQASENQALRAKGFLNVARILLILGQHSEAEAPLRQAESLLSKLVAESPSVVEYQLLLSSVWNRLAESLSNQNKKEDARGMHQKSLAAAERLVALDPDNMLHRFNLAVELLNLGNAIFREGQIVEAEKLYHRAQSHLENVTARPDALPKSFLYLSSCYNNLANISSAKGNYPAAAASLTKALLARERLAKDFPDEPEHRVYLSNTHNNIAANHLRENKLPQAIESIRKVTSIRQQLVAEFPGVPIYQQDLARAVIKLGELLLGQNHPESALTEFDRALAAVAMAPQSDRWPQIFAGIRGDAATGRARALVGLKRYSEALAEWERAIDLQAPALRPNLQLERAGTLARTGEHVKAAEVAEKMAAGTKATGPVLYDCACVLALSAAAAMDDAKLSEQYAARAFALLGLSDKAGFFRNPERLAHLRKDADFDYLRARDEFKNLVSELESALRTK